MALIQQMDSPPLFADNTAYSAGLVRRLLGRFVGGLVGRFNNSDFGVTLSGSTVTVSSGRACIPATATETGTYFVEATSSTVLTLDPADQTRDRIDVLVAYVVPPVTPQDTGKWFLEIRKGIPAASPVAPDVANTYWIAEFLVPKASDGIQPSVTDRRLSTDQHYITGPTLWGEVRPTAARFGQIWTDRINRHTWVYDGVGWVRLNQGLPVFTNPSSVVAPYTDQVIVDRGTGTLKRYTGSAFDDVEALKPKGKRWRTANFHQLEGSGGVIPMQAGRVQGGVTSSTNGLIIPRDGVYRVWAYGYATGVTEWRAGFALYRGRSGVTARALVVMSYWKKDNQDYMDFAADDVPLQTGDEVYLMGSGAGHTWGIDEVSGVRFGVEYLRNLHSGVSPV